MEHTALPTRVVSLTRTSRVQAIATPGLRPAPQCAAVYKVAPGHYRPPPGPPLWAPNPPRPITSTRTAAAGRLQRRRGPHHRPDDQETGRPKGTGLGSIPGYSPTIMAQVRKLKFAPRSAAVPTRPFAAARRRSVQRRDRPAGREQHAAQHKHLPAPPPTFNLLVSLAFSLLLSRPDHSWAPLAGGDVFYPRRSRQQICFTRGVTNASHRTPSRLCSNG